MSELALPKINRFTILNRGKSLGTYEKKELPREKLISMMAGGEELDQLEIELKEMERIDEKISPIVPDPPIPAKTM